MRVPRYTVRRMMVVVAIFGILSFLARERWGRQRRIFFANEYVRHTNARVGLIGQPGKERLAEYHKAMASKYGAATVDPWLPVEPDPPEPR